MKKNYCRKGFFLSFFCILFFASCRKTSVQPGVSLQEVLIEYASLGYVSAFTASGDGKVFLVSLGMDGYYCLCQYDIDGECTGQYSLGQCAMVEAVASNEDGSKVYFSGQHSANGMALMAVDTETGEFEVLYEFSYFEKIKKLVLLGNRIYVLGQQKWGSTFWEVGSDYDFLAEEMLMYYSLDTGEVYRLGFEYPINIAAMENGNLMVLGRLAGTGYCLMEYDLQADSMQVCRVLEAFKFDDFAVCNSGESLLYGYPGNQHGLVISDFDNFALETEVYEYAAQGIYFQCVAYVEGRVYCKDSFSGNLVGFPLECVQRRNKEIHMISANLPLSPYGCGYVLNRMEMSWDQIVLKMLAQDQNFDLCMGASDYSSSQILRDSNTFYPLNDVPGVEEYLDRCFPYVREAATQDGMIWMLPFSVWTPVLLVQEEALAEEGIALRDNMTFAELAGLVKELSPGQKRQLCFLPYAEGRAFLRQYLSCHVTLQDSIVLESLQSLSLLQQECLTATNKILPCMEATFGMDTDLDAHYLSRYEELGAVLYSLPKGRRDDKTVMSCYFLAVNPDSGRLQETLSYIADLAGYLSQRNDLLYFEEYHAEPGSLADQLHEQFRKGEIPFTIDWEVYGPGFEEMLYGQISAEEYIKETERKLRFYLGESF